MGWSEYHATHYKNGKVDRKAECDGLFSKECTILKSAMKGSTYYAAIKTPDEDVVGYVVLTSGTNRQDPYFNFGYKAISETCGPCQYDCPKSILDLLTPTDSKWANEWREKCRAKLTHKPWLKNLPIGGRIVFTDWKGNEHTLMKHKPAYQFRTWFWYDEDKGTYIPKAHVKEEMCRKVEA